ncbi:hypothetical protein BDD12DRAFT_808466 [Trichophaea hybrida]|nr:hypothetical protein BDD12DRAFT_808466 [Trichophaea hybrida]
MWKFRSLLWEAVLDGLLHSHPWMLRGPLAWTSPYSPEDTLMPGLSCWRHPFAYIFGLLSLENGLSTDKREGKTVDLYTKEREEKLHADSQPPGLPLADIILATESTVLAAFIFLCAKDVDPKPQRQPLSTETNVFDYADVKIQLQADVLTGLKRALLHGTPQRSLTKQEVTNLLRGYPPFYRDTIDSHEVFDLPAPIPDDTYLARDGWVITAGLITEVQPAPEYVDSIHCPGYDGAGVFYRSFEHILAVISKIIAPRYPEDKAIQPDSEEVLTSDMERRLKIDIAHTALYILAAALEAVRKCMEYLEVPGRALDRTKLGLEDGVQVYVEGCQYE